jgi:hypothetical protein
VAAGLTSGYEDVTRLRERARKANAMPAAASSAIPSISIKARRTVAELAAPPDGVELAGRWAAGRSGEAANSAHRRGGESVGAGAGRLDLREAGLAAPLPLHCEAKTRRHDHEHRRANHTRETWV